MDRTTKIKMKDSAASRSETEASGNLHFINFGENEPLSVRIDPENFCASRAIASG
jgi:hypothetical protein